MANNAIATDLWKSHFNPKTPKSGNLKIPNLPHPSHLIPHTSYLIPHTSTTTAIKAALFFPLVV